MSGKQLLPIAETWVVEEDGELVDVMSVIDDLIGGLFTHPDHQGNGHGRALVEHARLIYDPVMVEVFQANEGQSASIGLAALSTMSVGSTRSRAFPS